MTPPRVSSRLSEWLPVVLVFAGRGGSPSPDVDLGKGASVPDVYRRVGIGR